MQIDESDKQSEKASLSITESPETGSNVTAERDLHPAKHRS
jgi:hypothetical protein